MRLTHRKTKSRVDESSNSIINETSSSRRTTNSESRRRKRRIVTIFICTAIITYSLFIQHKRRKQKESNILLLSSNTAIPDDEETITSGRLPMEDVISPLFKEELIACMPTVSRGDVEYVSNAVKSWRLATNGSTVMRRLIVFDMNDNNNNNNNNNNNIHDDKSKTNNNHWLHRVFMSNPNLKSSRSSDSSSIVLPSWLELHHREGTVRKARKQTLGDSASRVAWRSKEAQDYAQALRRCSSVASDTTTTTSTSTSKHTIRYILMIQDDVLFTSRFQKVVKWADATLQEHEYIEKSTGRRRMQRICSGSLFDITNSTWHSKDGHVLQSSNMVARLWKMEFIHRIVHYVEVNFDEKPVDWLIDEMCHRNRRVTLVMQPNVVRHRGEISSYPENKRQGLLT